MTVRNTCGEHRRVRVVWKCGPDGGCNKTCVGNFTFGDSSLVTATFDKLGQLLIRLDRPPPLPFRS